MVHSTQQKPKNAKVVGAQFPKDKNLRNNSDAVYSGTSYSGHHLGLVVSGR